uniref:Non-specific serine/threonine protein kinase n=1 Tax=Strongyloides papillosus TaxID=174720 RepID=A0A0N5BS69_STREA
MVSRSRSRSNNRKLTKAPSRIPTIPYEEYSAISNGDRDTLRGTVNKTGYLGDISSAASVPSIPKIHEASINVNCIIDESVLAQRNAQNKFLKPDITAGSKFNAPPKKVDNIIDRRYQSCCIDDTHDGTILFNNTKPMMPLNVKQGNESLKLGAIKNYPLFDGSSDDETFQISEVKQPPARPRTKSLKQSYSKEESVKAKNNNNCIAQPSNEMEYMDTNQVKSELRDQVNSTSSAQQTTTLGLYSEFKREYETLLDGSRVLAEVSSNDTDKVVVKLSANEVNPPRLRKTEKKQPSPIPKERRTEMSEIDSYTLKKPSIDDKKNISKKYNRMTLAQQLEKSFRENNINLNNTEVKNLGDPLNHTYRHNLEETLTNFDIKCLANSTTKEESIVRTLFTDDKSQKFSTPYLSRTFVKNLGLNRVAMNGEINEALLRKQKFSLANACSTEIVRQSSNPKIGNDVNTPTTISDIRLKNSESTNDNNIITTTNTQDIYSIDDNNVSETTKSNTTIETIIKEPIKKLDESINIITKT